MPRVLYIIRMATKSSMPSARHRGGLRQMMVFIALVLVMLIVATQIAHLGPLDACTHGLGSTDTPLGRLKSASRPGFYFVVYAPDYSEDCGGSTVLHLLVDRLNSLHKGLGPIAYVVPFGFDGYDMPPLTTNPAYKTPILPPWLPASEGVAIYPEVVHGNPLNARHVVRYMLYFPGIHGGPPASEYSTNDMIICYSPGFCKSFTGRHELTQVRVMDSYPHYYRELPHWQRNGTLVFHKKTEWNIQSIDRTNETAVHGKQLSAHAPKRERLEEFAAAEMFVSYDPATFRSVEAAMAGCVSVVMPFPNVSKEEWANSVGEEFRYGVAYGFDEVPYARKTLPLVWPHLESLVPTYDTQVTDFVARAVVRFGLN